MKKIKFIRNYLNSVSNLNNHNSAIVLNRRKYQEYVKNNDSKFKIICWSRRTGKDIEAFTQACEQCLDVPNSTVYYIFNTMKQGRMMILEGKTEDKISFIETVVNLSH